MPHVRRLLASSSHRGFDFDAASNSNRCHPSPGPKHGASLSSCLALIRLDVAYEGHTYGVTDFYLANSHIIPAQGACRHEALGGAERAGRSCFCVHQYLVPAPADQAHAPRPRRLQGRRLGCQRSGSTLSFYSPPRTAPTADCVSCDSDPGQRADAVRRSHTLCPAARVLTGLIWS